jgi:hypothetical protein
LFLCDDNFISMSDFFAGIFSKHLLYNIAKWVFLYRLILCGCYILHYHHADIFQVFNSYCDFPDGFHLSIPFLPYYLILLHFIVLSSYPSTAPLPLPKAPQNN